MSRNTTALLCLAALTCAAMPATGWAQGKPKRCITDGGQTIVTDRPCSAFNGSEAPATATSPGATARRLMAVRPSAFRPICAKSMEDLSYSLSAALDARDVNRFSSLYHWVGVSNASAIRILNRFERLAQRPVVDVELTGGSAGVAEWVEDAEGNLVPIERPARPPSGLRLRLQKPGGHATESVQFRFVRNFGCWWLSF